MVRKTHHPSCPARHAAGDVCICPGLGSGGVVYVPPAKRSRRRPLTAIAEALCFAGVLGFVMGLPIYLLWRYFA